MMNKEPVRLLTGEQVCELTTLGRSTINQKVAQGTFPKPIYFGKNKAAWPDYMVYNWIHSQIDSLSQAS